MSHLPSQQRSGVEDIKINTTAEYPTRISREMDHPMVMPSFLLFLYRNTFTPHISTVVNSSNPPPWVPRGTLVAERGCRKPLPPSLQSHHTQVWPTAREIALQSHIVYISGRPCNLGLKVYIQVQVLVRYSKHLHPLTISDTNNLLRGCCGVWHHTMHALLPLALTKS